MLFSADDCSGNPANGPQLVLERNEVIALLNLLERLSNSIEVHAWLGRMLARQTANALSYPALVFLAPLMCDMTWSREGSWQLNMESKSL